MKQSPAQTRNVTLVRRPSGQVEAPTSPTVSRQRTLQDARASAPIPALQVAPVSLATPPLQPSSLRQPVTPPLQPSAESSEVAEDSSIQPSPVVRRMPMNANVSYISYV